MLFSVLFMQSGAALGIQLLGVGSAALLFLEAWPLFVILTGWKTFSGKGNTVPILVYGLAQFFPVMMGLLLYFPVTEVFIPLVRLDFLLCLRLFADTTLRIDGKDRKRGSG